MGTRPEPTASVSETSLSAYHYWQPFSIYWSLELDLFRGLNRENARLGERPMSAEKSLAIVIRRVEFSESSYVATLFTETHGKITGLAKGARRPKSAFENALDLLAISRVVFLTKSSGAMELLTEAKLERRFQVASRDDLRLFAGYYVAELLNALTDERDPHPELFRTSARTLVALDDAGDVGREILRFELAVLKNLGQMPAVDACVECGRLIDDSASRVSFGQLAGGVLCARCRPGHRHVASLSRDAISRLAELAEELQRDDEPLTSDQLIREVSRTLEPNCGGTPRKPILYRDQMATFNRKERALRGELRGLMTHRFSHLLGRRAKMHSFLTVLR